MADQRQSGGEHANEALQDMVSDPAMDITENDDDDHPFETSTYHSNTEHSIQVVSIFNQNKIAIEEAFLK